MHTGRPRVSGPRRQLYRGNPSRTPSRSRANIRERSAPADRIAVLGSAPEIYFYSGRRAATGYLHTSPLMEAQPYADGWSRKLGSQTLEMPHFNLVEILADLEAALADKPDARIDVINLAQKLLPAFPKAGHLLVGVHFHGRVLMELESRPA